MEEEIEGQEKREKAGVICFLNQLQTPLELFCNALPY